MSRRLIEREDEAVFIGEEGGGVEEVIATLEHDSGRGFMDLCRQRELRRLQTTGEYGESKSGKHRDALLLKLLKTPPEPCSNNGDSISRNLSLGGPKKSGGLEHPIEKKAFYEQ